MTISGIPLIGSISTSKYVLPIANNFTVNINSGTTTVSSDVAFITGSKAYIAEGAQVTVSSGKNVYVYDSDDWGNYAGNSAKMYRIAYSTVNGTTAIRNNDSLVDAVFDVNGTLNISGGFYTTTGGADITTSERTGKIVYNAAPGTATTTKQIEEQSDIVTVAITSAKLHNGDGTFTATAGSSSGDFFTYSSKQNKWIKGYEKYTVTWQNYDGTVLETDANVNGGTAPSYDGATPSRASDELCDYTFAGWSPELLTVTDDVTYVASYDRDLKTDLDDDGVFDLVDVGLVISASADLVELTSSQQAKANIVGNDGVVDGFDAAKFDRLLTVYNSWV